MNKQVQIKKQLEKLMTQEENVYCFDCDKKPAHWASVNNGIYLCMDCSGEHRGLGVSISYIRSVTLDTWNENQLLFLMNGGNKRLKDFIKYYNIPRSIPKKQFYGSKILDYYRKKLKSEVSGEYNDISIPDKRDMLDIYNPNTDYSKSSENFNTMKINISNDHYSKNYSSVSKDDTYNDRSLNDRFTSVSSKYNSDSRFASVSSDPFNPDEEVPDYRASSSGTTSSKIYSFLGAALNKTKNLAILVKDKAGEVDWGTKLKYGSEKTVDVLKYTGSKVYEKGSDIYQSETFKNISGKATEGIGYVKEKIFGPKPQNGNGIENGNSDRFGSASSSNYNYNDKKTNLYSNSDKDDTDVGGNYVKMDDNNKKENLLDRNYENY